MADIHPTAIIDSSANLGDGVVVGPYSIIEEDVSIGRDTWVGPHVVIRKHTDIGAANRIFQFCSIGEMPQHQGYEGEPTRLLIGDRNTIREYSTINRGTDAKIGGLGLTRIGDSNMLMAYTHIAHDCILGDQIIFANGASLAGHVEVASHAILGGFTLVHQFCRIGKHCMTGIGCICLQDIPPYIVAAGNPAEPHGINNTGLKRRDFDSQTIQLLNRAYRIFYRKNLDMETAVERIRNLSDDEHVHSFADFMISCSKRSIIR
ncbi:MAG: acyl-ACP--UDP-N-acetylglucosamine O-acyltransferase [Gammaproteobacteria bacterium]|nr:acyl-ACP--UDP-N-acetylglucosamine O-acyltransferase [Gammaproteobacteria bacterium]